MKHLNLETSFMTTMQTQLSILFTLLDDKSTSSVFTNFYKSFNHKIFLSTTEMILKISKQNRIIPENLVNQLIGLIIDFISNISIEEKVQSIQFYLSAMRNFIFFLKAKKFSENDKIEIEKISTIFDKINQPLEDQEFTYEGDFLGEFNKNFQDLVFFALKFYKYSESLSRQFITYSKSLELTINELFQLSSIVNQLNYLCSILECYASKILVKSFDMVQEQEPIFHKKLPKKKFISNDMDDDIQAKDEIIQIPAVKVCFT